MTARILHYVDGDTFGVTERSLLQLVEGLAPRWSPDGSKLAFVAVDPGGHSMLWIRDLDSQSAQPLPGTDGAFMPSSEAAAANIHILQIQEPFQAVAAGYALEPEFFGFMRKS